MTAHDIQCSLKYCARTFFERDDADLQAIVREELERMREEEDDDGEEDEEEEEGEEEDEEDENPTNNVADESDVQLARHVDAIVKTWHLWEPVDPCTNSCAGQSTRRRRPSRRRAACAEREPRTST